MENSNSVKVAARISPDHYVGSELELFRHAMVWKRYFTSRMAPFLSGSVLEVGAGNGNNTHALAHCPASRWVCLEPDPRLLSQIDDDVQKGRLPARTAVIQGKLSDLAETEIFDTVLYLDVLEHIEDDRGELEAALTHLRPGGRLIVLSPAWQWLYSPFDKAIGHMRRYDKRSLTAIKPAAAKLVKAEYLDSCGLLASSCNRLFLQQSYPTLKQLLFWDRVLVRGSRWIDPMVGRRMGKSVLVIFERI